MCGPNNDGGDWDAGKKRTRRWIMIGATGGFALAYLLFAGQINAGGIDSLWLTLAVFLIAAAAGIIAGSIYGAIDVFRRLKEQNPRTITIQGMVFCTHKNALGIQLPLFDFEFLDSDGDWVCNIGGTIEGDSAQFFLLLPEDLAMTVPEALTELDEVRMRPGDGSNLQRAYKSYNQGNRNNPNDPLRDDIIHCEISSNIGYYCLVGGAIGSVLGTVAGIVIAAILCGALTPFCIFIIALGAAIGAGVGTVVGQLLGSLTGQVADWLIDFDALGGMIKPNTMVAITGRWVTDTTHQHNEIHDIEAVSILDSGGLPDPTTPPILLAAAIGIGRCPSGGTPIIL